MRSAFLSGGSLVVGEIDDPVPGFGQVLVKVLACGICGSDLHFVHHGQKMSALGAEMGQPSGVDFDRPIFMGHEFSAEVLEAGPDTVGPAPGTVVTSLPAMITMEGPAQMAYTNDYPAGYSEQMLLSAPLLLEVPNGLDPRVAALTEPMAVGIHAVNRSMVVPGESAIVIGCGPVGLACIAALRHKGVETIVAADFSPTRRRLAGAMGATELVDPRVEPAIEAWRRVDGRTMPVLFEAVGLPGMLYGAMRDAPQGARIVVVGVCMQRDDIQPFFGIAKELNIQFVLGYDPMEFAASLRLIAEGTFDVGPLITGSVDVDGTPGAFEALADPERHCKILVEPGT
ncbi:MAG: zinc-binding dehydrogenase [Actinomycetota bacterium]|nr:zinc-binding dehydrogenase [Actinomycetota bacterium]